MWPPLSMMCAESFEVATAVLMLDPAITEPTSAQEHHQDFELA